MARDVITQVVETSDGPEACPGWDDEKNAYTTKVRENVPLPHGERLICGHKKMKHWDMGFKVKDRYDLHVSFWECAECGMPHAVGFGADVKAMAYFWSGSERFNYREAVRKRLGKTKEKAIKQLAEAHEALRNAEFAVNAAKNRMEQTKEELKYFGLNVEVK